jgi:hypothetical protein
MATFPMTKASITPIKTAQIPAIALAMVFSELNFVHQKRQPLQV